MDTLKRREFVQKAVLAGAGLALGPAVTGRIANHMETELTSRDVHFFSKHLQFLDYPGAAEACAEAGFSGADLTVRPGGHVLPENVERDLPLAVKSFTEAGLKTEMMTTGITDPEDPLTDIVLRTASELGIRYYRLGYYHYDPGLSVVNNLERIRVNMQGLALLNEKYRIHGAYQNHAGTYFGAPVWDLWEVIRDMDPEWTGCQYDIRHAKVEGNQSWPLGMKLLKDHIRCMVIKDFTWGVEGGRAREINVPVGEGVVDFEACFRLVSELGIHGPITMHMEYEMFPEKEMTVDQMKDHAIRLMKKDLEALRQYL